MRYGYVYNPDVQMDADVESKPVEMISKWPSYFRIGETRNQETVVQRTFHLERTSFYLSALIVRTLYFAHSCTKHGPLFLSFGSGARETTSLLACMTTPPLGSSHNASMQASYPNVKEDLNDQSDCSSVMG